MSTDTWSRLAKYFEPPREYRADLGKYRSPLLFDDGRPVRTAADWPARRQEILKAWHALMGPWPPLVEKPEVRFVETKQRDGLVQKKVQVEVAAGHRIDGYLLLPEGQGPFAAVLVVFYDPETGAGLNPKHERLDFGYQLSRRGFVSLSLGNDVWNETRRGEGPQHLSYLAYVAANAHTALAAMPEVDPKRIGIVGHSFGGKWAMLASCLYDKFACAVWSDPGIVFDETRPNVNYWEPWYLGREPSLERRPGLPTETNPRTGPYKRLVEAGRDLHELHALMAPRPFLVSGGSEDPPERWRALNHAVAVNRLLGRRDRVAMTNRPEHPPTPESNEYIYMFFEHFLAPGRAAEP
jgi:pimeloyl-ACP methyl ester carboxylesterase